MLSQREKLHLNWDFVSHKREFRWKRGDVTKDSDERQLSPQRIPRHLVEHELGSDGRVPGKVYIGLVFTD